VEGAALVVKGLARLALSLLSGTKGAEVLHGLGDGITEQAHDDASAFAILDIDVKKDLVGDLFCVTVRVNLEDETNVAALENANKHVSDEHGHGNV